MGASGEVGWLSDEEQDAWRGLQRMQLQLTGRLSRELSANGGLSYQDYAVLVVLTDRDDGRMRVLELGRELGWEKSRLSHHLQRMVGRGLVCRERCPSDQRGAFIVVSAEGRRALEASAPGHVAAVRRYFVDLLTPAQLRSLSAITGVVLDSLASQCQQELDGEGALEAYLGEDLSTEADDTDES
jgi:DNA-binding MarR family transcriptional regulator